MQTTQKTAKKAKKVAKKVKKSPKKTVLAKRTRTTNLGKVPKTFHKLMLNGQAVKLKDQVLIDTVMNHNNLTVAQINKLPNHFMTKTEATKAKSMIATALRG